MSTIVDIIARQILDSRGNPTVEVDVLLQSGAMGRSSVPSGASTGSREAIELRDGDYKYYFGMGVTQAVKHVNTEIRKALIGLDVKAQVAIDKILIDLDGSHNKAQLGANALLGVSMSVAKAAAQELGLQLYRYFGGIRPMSLPVPMMNIINGGKHANNGLCIQEFMIVPVGFASFHEALRCGAEIFHTLKKLLDKSNYSTAVGDEGGFAPRLKTNLNALELIVESIHNSGYIPGSEVFLALDCAASEFYQDSKYRLPSEDLCLSSAELIDYLATLVDTFPIISIEDGIAENDWDGWKLLTDRLGHQVQIVGDDLFVTNTKILHEGIQKGIANSILIKINQIGTLSETFAAIEMAKHASYSTVISHRSGETEDSIIADIAVGLNTLQIKTGSLSRSDRVAKYNQLLRIEEELGSSAKYAGHDAFYNFQK